jgi:hypothetical protein
MSVSENLMMQDLRRAGELRVAAREFFRAIPRLTGATVTIGVGPVAIYCDPREGYANLLPISGTDDSGPLSRGGLLEISAVIAGAADAILEAGDPDFREVDPATTTTTTTET